MTIKKPRDYSRGLAQYLRIFIRDQLLELQYSMTLDMELYATDY